MIDSENRWARKLPTAIMAVSIAALLVVIKTIAYFHTGAMSLLTSLTDSVIDSTVSIMALSSILYAQRPADEDHRWGHGKIEAVSALVQASMMIGGAAFLIFTAVERFDDPKPIMDHWLGIAVMLASIFLSFVLVYWQRKTLDHFESLAIEADHLHYSTDVVINTGTLVILFATLKGAPLWIDSVFAVLAACLLAYLAWSILERSLHTLLDRELPEDERDAIIERIESHHLVLGWHDLRTRRHGDFHDISFDIEVDASLSLWDAHEVTKDIERELIQLYDKCDVMIHVDPQGFTEDERHRVKGIHI
ncbi:MAG TPA: hypothetical protein DEB46_00275 [Myxococcales bacterium]|nr:hypothetical protein [Myxococcales bacterium]